MFKNLIIWQYCSLVSCQLFFVQCYGDVSNLKLPFQDLESEVKTLKYTKNGTDLGIAMSLSVNLENTALFPHIFIKNMEVEVNFGSKVCVCIQFFRFTDGLLEGYVLCVTGCIASSGVHYWKGKEAYAPPAPIL